MGLKTAISKVTDDDLIVRGEKLSQLAETKPFADVIFHLLKGPLPTEAESKLFSAMLSLSIDHGMATASAMTARFVQSTGNSLNTAVGAGILALGKYHGGAIEGCMQQLLAAAKQDIPVLVAEKLQNKEKFLGFGHKIYKEQDPRTQQLVALAKKLQFQSNFLTLAQSIEQELEKQKGKRLVLNIDGCIAALLLDMGFPPEAGNGIFIIARVPGLVAHAVEERNEPPVRRFEEKDITYVGK